MPIGNYSKAVAEQRKLLLKHKVIRDVARGIGTADSQIVRLLNGSARRPSYKLLFAVGKALGYKGADEFYAELLKLWQLMHAERLRKRKRQAKKKPAA
jgi:transcriptional regulator with XRE-family HTH domain